MNHKFILCEIYKKLIYIFILHKIDTKQNKINIEMQEYNLPTNMSKTELLKSILKIPQNNYSKNDAKNDEVTNPTNFTIEEKNEALLELKKLLKIPV